ncbi:MAG: hypothetical protein CYPHOPRED_005083 [Cyphobasidiales sp. Tagirdzhanova-0007]|nr:MAG: hypothetical protein CYPHOPRED_005083 [Cyphobasidiales sp. Tagirdzhanova-0007]
MAKAAQLFRETEEREELALKAKQNLVSQYLHLGSCMKRCSLAVEAYSHAINDSISVEEVRELLKPPTAGPMPVGLPDQFPFLSTAKAIKKRSKSEESEEDGGLDIDGKKKKRKNKKADKDPNAPRRPMSAYLMFQNAIRQEMKEKNPDVSYKELIGQVGEAWKQLGEDGQKPYKDAADNLMASWKTDTVSYNAAKDGSMAVDGEDAFEAAQVEDAMVAKEIKKERKPKEPKTVNAITNAQATLAPPAPDPATKEKKSSKKESAPAIPATKASAVSAPASKGIVPPKPVSNKKTLPVQPVPAYSSSEEESTSDDE